MVSVRIPTNLRPLVGDRATMEVEGARVRDVLDAIERDHPGFAGRVLDESGRVRRFVNVYVDEDDIRFLDGLDTPVTSGQTVSILPAVAGGSPVA